MQYAKTHDFIICSKLEKLYLELGYYLNTLSNSIKGFDKILINQNPRLNKLKVNLDHVLLNIKKAQNRKVKDSHTMIEILCNEKNRLTKIAGYCEGIATENQKKLSDKFYQLAQTVKDNIASINENLVTESKNEHEYKIKVKNILQTFTIEMRSKDEVRTLLLGDEGLGPCMASDSREGFYRNHAL